MQGYIVEVVEGNENILQIYLVFVWSYERIMEKHGKLIIFIIFY